MSECDLCSSHAAADVVTRSEKTQTNYGPTLSPPHSRRTPMLAKWVESRACGKLCSFIFLMISALLGIARCHLKISRLSSNETSRCVVRVPTLDPHQDESVPTAKTKHSKP